MKAILSWLIPQRCLLCQKLTDYKTLICPSCELYLPWDIGPPETDQSLFSLFQYRPPISQFISRLKFQHQLIYAQLFAYFFMFHLEDHRSQPLPKRLIPVPLHPKRLGHRGFNQSLEIAKPISRYFKIALDFKSCQRIIHTPPQIQLAERQRKSNLKNAFLLKEAITDSHVAIIDDVFTTGATTQALKQLLEDAGVKEVEIWCCARTPLK